MNEEIWEIIYAPYTQNLISIKLIEIPDFIKDVTTAADIFGVHGYVTFNGIWYINLKTEKEIKHPIYHILKNEVIKFKRLEKLKEIYE